MYIKNKIATDVKLIQHYSNGMIISLPLFGNLIIEIEKTPIDAIEEIEQDDGDKTIKLVIRTEFPVRLGVRELKRLKDFEKYVDSIFDVIENLLFAERKLAKQNYAVCDLSRTTYFVEHKKFELKDTALRATVSGTDNKLTIITPIDYMAEATEKYHFV